jgi:tetratricopeptide (TPR) repeat protein
VDCAIEDYTHALALQPNHVDARIGRGLAYYRQDYLDQAIADHTRVLTLKPNGATIYCNRELACLDLGWTEEAIADFQSCQDFSHDPNLIEGSRRQLQGLGADP